MCFSMVQQHLILLFTLIKMSCSALLLGEGVVLHWPSQSGLDWDTLGLLCSTSLIFLNPRHIYNHNSYNSVWVPVVAVFHRTCLGLLQGLCPELLFTHGSGEPIRISTSSSQFSDCATMAMATTSPLYSVKMYVTYSN